MSVINGISAYPQSNCQTVVKGYIAVDNTYRTAFYSHLNGDLSFSLANLQVIWLMSGRVYVCVCVDVIENVRDCSRFISQCLHQPRYIYFSELIKKSFIF